MWNTLGGNPHLKDKVLVHLKDKVLVHLKDKVLVHLKDKVLVRGASAEVYRKILCLKFSNKLNA
jgi:hypothetical protein